MKKHCFTSIFFFIPIPELLLSQENYSETFKNKSFGFVQSPLENDVLDESHQGTHVVKSSSFIRSVSSLKYNKNYLSLKYRKQFQIYYYQQGKTFHSPNPVYTITQHNVLISKIKEKCKIINPTIKIEIFEVGIVFCEFSFSKTNFPSGYELSTIKSEFKHFLIKIKPKSILNAIFNQTFSDKVYSVILPDEGYTIIFTSTEPEKTGFKHFLKINQGRTDIFLNDEFQIIVHDRKLTPIIRRDIMNPIKWILGLSTSYEVHTKRIIEWMQTSGLSTLEYQSLWIAAAHSLNPNFHFTNFGGRSPLFPRTYQKGIFEKFSKVKYLDKRFSEFIKIMKHQGMTFTPLSHHAIIILEKNHLLDPRLRLLTGIRSNIRRKKIDQIHSLSRLEKSILRVLEKKYSDDYSTYLRDMNLNTQNFGWIFFGTLGKGLKWSEYGIYTKKKNQLRRQLKILVRKGLIITKPGSAGRTLLIKLNDNNYEINARLSKVVYRVNDS